MNSFVFTVILTALSGVNCARILGVYPFPAYSHYQLCNTIMKELARRGHEVTVIAPFKEENPPQNFEQIVLYEVVQKSEEAKSSIINATNFNIFRTLIWLDQVGIFITNLTLSHPKIRNFLEEKNSFDLVIYQQFLSDAYSGFCYHFNAPCILINALSAPSMTNKRLANPGSPSYVPQLFVNFVADMNFMQRVYNTFVYALIETIDYFYLYPAQNRLLQQYFPNAPDLDVLYYNVSLLLINSHVSINDVAPSLPNLIHIAGAHVKKPAELPINLQEFLNEAKEGAILFSMGANLKSRDLPKNKLNSILKVFSKLKHRVLWKWESEILLNKSDNVLISNWFPQQDVLAHPNVVLFITHGGLMSTIEAVYHGVPVLGIPVFIDQGLNMARAELAGYGKSISYNNLNEENLAEAMNEILMDPKFKINAKRRSAILRDAVIEPLDNAVFWIEYVLRHQGAFHLQSTALKLHWYQYYLLDVGAFAILLLILILALTINIVRSICRLCRFRNDTKTLKKIQ